MKIYSHLIAPGLVLQPPTDPMPRRGSTWLAGLLVACLYCCAGFPPALAFAACLLLASGALPTLSAEAGQRETSQAFFDGPTVRGFQFEISSDQLATLRRSPRAYVRGTMRDGSRVLTNVGFHLKGMGSFRTVDEKASFAVKFDEFTKDQEYAELTKLMFNNAVQDPTYLAEWLATGLFRDAGVPAARVTHARVQLNGKDLGLYVVIEAMNKRFLKQHFSSAKGNLYETCMQDIDGPLDQDNGELSAAYLSSGGSHLSTSGEIVSNWCHSPLSSSLASFQRP